MKNKVSVIIPVYNVEKYLSQCLESVVGQTYKNLEVIIVDDGSTDGSTEICRAWAKRDRRIRVIRQENVGVASARNAGLDAATGEYVHFIDSDDCISLDYYERMVRWIGGADMAASGFYNEKVPAESISYPAPFALVSTEDKLCMTDVVCQAMVWRFLFRRDFLVRCGLRFTDGMLIEDIMFSIPAAFFADRIIAVPGAVYFYRNNPSSILNDRNREKQECRRRDQEIVEKCLAHFMECNGICACGREVADVTRFRLFGFIPFLKKKSYRYRIVYRLFGIPVLRIRRSVGVHRARLFGIPVMKVGLT
ncbi:MAG: glycosyltransferase [Rickettsiales bacterium]|jgi:glycosyltransferase involved in cell wall biosynthesis|nr:glycosyltransferase [Rickettsiales bacterium]